MITLKTRRFYILLISCLFLSGVVFNIYTLLLQPDSGYIDAYAQELDCSMCHGQLSGEKVVHAALHMGCATCHSQIDAKDIPHKLTGKISKGLSSEQPELCYTCHDKAKFSKKTVHAAIGMGCTGCHNAHSSKNEKLLLSEMPELCYNCHDKAKFAGNVVHSPIMAGMCTGCHSPHASDQEKLLLSGIPDLCYNCHSKGEFEKKTVHMPVAGGMCMSCHSPHVSEEFALLNKKDVVGLCLECHPKIDKKKHVIATGHPVGEPKKGKPAPMDLARKDKRFYCGSCHNPHSSDNPKLFRYKAKSAFDLCGYCHKM